MAALEVVELADERTWPPEFRDLANSAASYGSLEDRWLPNGIDEDAFTAALQGRLLRSYHCTRLTATEMTWITSEGLRPLSPDLVLRKIDQAVVDGHLTAAECELYKQSHLADEDYRAGDVCFFGDRTELMDVPNVYWLLAVWGGEGINQAFHTDSPESLRLQNIGTPAVVVALVDPLTQISYATPGVGLSAARRVAGDEAGTEVRTNETIDAERIEAIHSPGSAFWDQYVGWTP